jgi:hypothetical protein
MRTTPICSLCAKNVTHVDTKQGCGTLVQVFDPILTFPSNIFGMLQHLDSLQQQVFAVALWSIWKHRSIKVWNDMVESAPEDM